MQPPFSQRPSSFLEPTGLFNPSAVPSTERGGGKKRKAVNTPDSAPEKSKDKGLKAITLKVCEVVRDREVTNYPDVADACVADAWNEDPDAPPLAATGDGKEPSSWEKNIRRRVYDALNVLCVMDVIDKQGKSIHWKGLPNQATTHYEDLVVSALLLRLPPGLMRAHVCKYGADTIKRLLEHRLSGPV